MLTRDIDPPEEDKLEARIVTDFEKLKIRLENEFCKQLNTPDAKLIYMALCEAYDCAVDAAVIWAEDKYTEEELFAITNDEEGYKEYVYDKLYQMDYDAATS